jgi:hypothetical protein
MFLEAIDNPHIKFSVPPEGSNVCMCVCLCVCICVNVNFFMHFSFKKNYMYLQGNTTWLIRDILMNIDF